MSYPTNLSSHNSVSSLSSSSLDEQWKAIERAIEVKYSETGLSKATFYHGTSTTEIESVLAGPKNIGEGFGGKGLYLSVDDKALADEIASTKTQFRGKPAILQGNLNPKKDFRVASITLAATNRTPDLSKGIFPADWSRNSQLQQLMHDNFDLLIVNDAAKGGYAIDTDRFIVVHERAGKEAISWKTSQSQYSSTMRKVTSTANSDTIKPSKPKKPSKLPVVRHTVSEIRNGASTAASEMGRASTIVSLAVGASLGVLSESEKSTDPTDPFIYRGIITGITDSFIDGIREIIVQPSSLRPRRDTPDMFDHMKGGIHSFVEKMFSTLKLPHPYIVKGEDERKIVSKLIKEVNEKHPFPKDFFSWKQDEQLKWMEALRTDVQKTLQREIGEHQKKYYEAKANTESSNSTEPENKQKTKLSFSFSPFGAAHAAEPSLLTSIEELQDIFRAMQREAGRVEGYEAVDLPQEMLQPLTEAQNMAIPELATKADQVIQLREKVTNLVNLIEEKRRLGVVLPKEMVTEILSVTEEYIQLKNEISEALHKLSEEKLKSMFEGLERAAHAIHHLVEYERASYAKKLKRELNQKAFDKNVQDQHESLKKRVDYRAVYSTLHEFFYSNAKKDLSIIGLRQNVLEYQQTLQELEERHNRSEKGLNELNEIFQNSNKTFKAVCKDNKKSNRPLEILSKGLHWIQAGLGVTAAVLTAIPGGQLAAAGVGAIAAGVGLEASIVDSFVDHRNGSLEKWKRGYQDLFANIAKTGQGLQKDFIDTQRELSNSWRTLINNKNLFTAAGLEKLLDDAFKSKTKEVDNTKADITQKKKDKATCDAALKTATAAVKKADGTDKFKRNKKHQTEWAAYDKAVADAATAKIDLENAENALPELEKQQKKLEEELALATHLKGLNAEAEATIAAEEAKWDYDRDPKTGRLTQLGHTQHALYNNSQKYEEVRRKEREIEQALARSMQNVGHLLGNYFGSDKPTQMVDLLHEVYRLHDHERHLTQFTLPQVKEFVKAVGVGNLSKFDAETLFRDGIIPLLNLVASCGQAVTIIQAMTSSKPVLSRQEEFLISLFKQESSEHQALLQKTIKILQSSSHTQHKVVLAKIEHLEDSLATLGQTLSLDVELGANKVIADHHQQTVNNFNTRTAKKIAKFKTIANKFHDTVKERPEKAEKATQNLRIALREAFREITGDCVNGALETLIDASLVAQHPELFTGRIATKAHLVSEEIPNPILLKGLDQVVRSLDPSILGHDLKHATALLRTQYNQFVENAYERLLKNAQESQIRLREDVKCLFLSEAVKMKGELKKKVDAQTPLPFQSKTASLVWLQALTTSETPIPVASMEKSFIKEFVQLAGYRSFDAIKKLYHNSNQTSVADLVHRSKLLPESLKKSLPEFLHKIPSTAILGSFFLVGGAGPAAILTTGVTYATMVTTPLFGGLAFEYWKGLNWVMPEQSVEGLKANILKLENAVSEQLNRPLKDLVQTKEIQVPGIQEIFKYSVELAYDHKEKQFVYVSKTIQVNKNEEPVPVFQQQTRLHSNTPIKLILEYSDDTKGLRIRFSKTSLLTRRFLQTFISTESKDPAKERSQMMEDFKKRLASPEELTRSIPSANNDFLPILLPKTLLEKTEEELFSLSYKILKAGYGVPSPAFTFGEDLENYCLSLNYYIPSKKDVTKLLEVCRFKISSFDKQAIKAFAVTHLVEQVEGHQWTTGEADLQEFLVHMICNEPQHLKDKVQLEIGKDFLEVWQEIHQEKDQPSNIQKTLDDCKESYFFAMAALKLKKKLFSEDAAQVLEIDHKLVHPSELEEHTFRNACFTKETNSDNPINAG